MTFAARSPFFLTLRDGFLRVDGSLSKRQVTAAVEGAKGPVPPPLLEQDELWVWIGDEPTKEEPAPRGTFVGVRLAQ